MDDSDLLPTTAQRLNIAELRSLPMGSDLRIQSQLHLGHGMGALRSAVGAQVKL
jgi:hypothetical protein